VLQSLDLPRGASAIPDALRMSYRQLVALHIVGEAELTLLDAWLEDLSALGLSR